MGHKRTRPKAQRMQIAKHWIPTYTGTKIVKGYRKRFSVDTLTALRELQELGVSFEPEYINAVQVGEQHRVLRLQAKKQERLIERENIINLYDDMDIWNDHYNCEINDNINIFDNHRINLECKIGIIKKDGKNHVRVNGTLLQTNKKWSHLKQKQKDWIYDTIRKQHSKYLNEVNKLPEKKDKDKLIENVLLKIDERGIWLPSHELKRIINKYIDKLNRKASTAKTV